jgi:predicted AlkP superfamily pyrophosphatase or phosphodiesterase
MNSSALVKDRVDNDLQELLDELKDRIARLKKKMMSVEDDLGMLNNTFDAIDQYGDMGK